MEPTAKQFKWSVSNLSGRTPPLQDASTPLNHPNSTPYPSASSVYEGTYRVMLRSPYSSRSGRYGLPQSNDFGPPMRFLVGPSDVAFDVDVNLLSEWSPAFARKPAVHHIDMLYTIYPIFLPDVSVNDFTVLCQWMYTGAKPESDRPEHLFPLCTLWIAASKLGLWRIMNTILRIGMGLMQPREFDVPIATVEYVYTHTDSSAARSKLREFIIAIFCQRGKVVPASFRVAAENAHLGIMRDCVRFLQIFVPPTVVPDAQTAARWEEEAGGIGGPVSRYRWASDAKGFPVFVCHDMFDGEEKVHDRGVKAKKGEWPLPEYLMWDAQGTGLPDELFVTPEEALGAAGDVVAQMEGMREKGLERLREIHRKGTLEGGRSG